MALVRTPRQLLKGSLRLIGVGGEDEDLSPSQLNDAFLMMNEWLMGQDHSFQYAIVRESFSLTTGTYYYNIGTGSDFNTERPHKVLSAFIRRGAADYPVKIIDRYEWDKIVYKSLSNYPTRLYYRPTYPNGTILLDAVPSSTDLIFLEMEKPMSEVATLDTQLSLPSEYARAIRFNMAIDLASEYEKEPPGAVVKAAQESLKNIERRNFANDMVTLDIDPMFKVGHTPLETAFGGGGGGSSNQIVVLDGDGNQFVVT